MNKHNALRLYVTIIIFYFVVVYPLFHYFFVRKIKTDLFALLFEIINLLILLVAIICLGVIYTEYRNYSRPKSLKDIIKFNFDNITKQTNGLIKFNYITEQPTDEHFISFSIQDFDKNNKVCGSAPVGFIDNKESNITLSCFDNYTITHEILHVLGLSHEHQRYDASKYVKIPTCEQVKKDFNQTNCTFYDINIKPRDNILNYELDIPFDYQSVMFYDLENNILQLYNQFYIIAKYFAFYDLIFNDPKKIDTLSKKDILKLKNLYK